VMLKLGRNAPCPCGSGKKYKKCCQGRSESRSTAPGFVDAGAPTSVECNQLVTLFDTGCFAELECRTRVLVEAYPNSGFAWKLLGASLKFQGKDALFALRRATELLPDDPETHNNLGVSLQELGQPDNAVSHYRRALQIKPDYAEAHNNLGIVLRCLGQYEEAEARYRLALKIKADYVDAYTNLGNVLKDLKRFDEAIASFRQALKIKPGFFDAHISLGNVLSELWEFEEAVAHYRRALEISPDDAGAYSNLGNALKDLRRFDEAVASFTQALKIKPDFAEAHYNLGITHVDLGQLDNAAMHYRQALQIKPDYAEAHNNLGNVLRSLGQLDEAEASYRLALEIKPDFAFAHSNLLFIHNYRSDQPAETLLTEARRFGELATRKARPYADWQNVPVPARCLRVGLVSGDLGSHPVGYFVEGILAALASSAAGRLELVAYSNRSWVDAVTERIKACCHDWHSVLGLSDERLSRQIRDDGIDILLDLSGHTAHNRLTMFAWKPAPIQVSWLGYFATTGVAAMDYLIADPWTLPEAEEAHFTERIWRLPETRLCFTPPHIDIEVAPLPALTNGHITFGCFNHLAKMNDDVVSLWAQVLASVPDSRLFLKAEQLANASMRQNTIKRFAVHNIEADRLTLEGPESRENYLASYHRVDIALDPFPFPGGATSAEGLWMGVPVLTLAGNRFLSRQGVGLLANVGLPEWIAADADAYVACAVHHVADLDRLSDLRKCLRWRVLASPVFDAPRFARNFETALRGMWNMWCDEQ
jgi:protein O-GlcNAc transferase